MKTLNLVVSMDKGLKEQREQNVVSDTNYALIGRGVRARHMKLNTVGEDEGT